MRSVHIVKKYLKTDLSNGIRKRTNVRVFDFGTSTIELRDIELVAAIINSQNNRKYHELLFMLKKFPF